MQHLKVSQRTNMWSKGTFTTDKTNKTCQYWVKHFDEPSEKYGIDGGCISKLTIKVNDKVTCNYDREWDIKPKDETSRLAYKAILKKFN